GIPGPDGPGHAAATHAFQAVRLLRRCVRNEIRGIFAGHHRRAPGPFWDAVRLDHHLWPADRGPDQGPDPDASVGAGADPAWTGGAGIPALPALATAGQGDRGRDQAGRRNQTAVACSKAVLLVWTLDCVMVELEIGDCRRFLARSASVS